MKNKPPLHPELEKLYQLLCSTPSDINEHLPKLRELASSVDHVTEMGVRGAVSTVALLCGQPDVLVSWDIDPAAIVNPMVAQLIEWSRESGTSFQPRVGSTVECSIEPTSLLFIDTLHTHDQLWAELNLHGDLVDKYLAFHDTETFGYQGEDKKKPGLLLAIKNFQDAEWLYKKNSWSEHYRSNANNGLYVLRLDERNNTGSYV